MGESTGQLSYDKANRQLLTTQSLQYVENGEVPIDNLLTTTYAYNLDGTIAYTQNSEGSKKVYSYDLDNNISLIKSYYDDTNYSSTAYTYNHFNKVLTQTVTVENQDIYGYSADSTPLNLVTSYTYDKNGNVLTKKDANGVVTTYTYDLMDRLLSTQQPGKSETGSNITVSVTNTYDWAGNILTVNNRGRTTTYTYDSRGNLAKIKDPAGKITAYTYDRAGRKTAEVSPQNYIGSTISNMSRTEYTYDLMGRVISVTEYYIDADTGAMKHFVSKACTYDNNGNVTYIQDALGYADDYGTEYEYDMANRVVAERDPESQREHLPYSKAYEYDAADRLVTETDALDTETSYTYDGNGNVLTIEIDGETVKENTYDYQNNLLASTDGEGNTTKYEYNNLNKVRHVFAPGDDSIDSLTTTYRYTKLGLAAEISNDNDSKTVYTYNNQGMVLTETESDGSGNDSATTAYIYDTYGNAKYVTDANGVKTTYAYNALNDVTSATVTVGAVKQITSYAYDANGNIITTTDWRGNVYTNTYDALNRLVQKTDPTGAIIEKLVYNDNNAQIYSIDALGNRTEFVYDRNGRLIETIDAEGNSQSSDYDGAGRKIHEQDANGNDTYYGYDSLGRLIEVENALGEATAYTYDDNGNLLSQADCGGTTVTLAYNCRNLPVERTDADGLSESYTYYADGSVESKTDRNGDTTQYEYDAHSRLTLEETGDESIGYTYDAMDNLLTMTDGTGTTTRTYDILGRVTSKTVPEIGTSTYAYDLVTGMPAGYIQETSTDPMGNVTAKTYDRAGRLSVAASDGNTATYTYNDNGSVESIAYSNGVSADYTYYDNGLLHTLANMKGSLILEAYNYTYDGAGNLIEALDSTGVTSYTYDALNRLLSVTEPDGTVTDYTYDSAGNRTVRQTTENGCVTEYVDYSYSEQNRLMETCEDLTTYAADYTTVTETKRYVTGYEYDDNGNVTAKADGEIYMLLPEAVVEESPEPSPEETDAVTEPEPETDPTPSTEPEPETGADPDGGITQPDTDPGAETEQAPAGDGGTNSGLAVANNLLETADVCAYTYYGYDIFNRLISIDSDTSEVSYAYNGDGLRVAKTVTADGDTVTTNYLYEYANVVLETDENGNETGFNVYGNDTLLMRTADDVTMFYLYNGHGDVTMLTDEDGDEAASYKYDAFGNLVDQTGDFCNSITYAGYQFDEESGLYYLRARFYDPDTARFMSEDSYYGTLDDPLSLNLYTYCYNNPLIYTDPTGHAVTEWDKANLTQAQQNAIQAATDAYNKAKAAGDTAGMATAHAVAEAVRSTARSSSEVGSASGYTYTVSNDGTATLNNYDSTALASATKGASSSSSGSSSSGGYFSNTVTLNGSNYIPVTTSTVESIVITNYNSMLPAVSEETQRKLTSAIVTAKTTPSTMANAMASVVANAVSTSYFQFYDVVLPSSIQAAIISSSSSNEAMQIRNDYYSQLLIEDGGASVYDTTKEILMTYGEISEDSGNLILNEEICNSMADLLGRKMTAEDYIYAMAGMFIPDTELAGNFEKMQAASFAGDGITTQMIANYYTVQVCFTEETMIHTADGHRKISDIEVGDYVYSKNIETGETGLKKVLNTFEHEAYALVHLTINGELINATPQHPFWVVDKGWTSAGDLTTDDVVVLYSGEEANIQSISVEQFKTPITVYNFEVDDWHTYFVSDENVLVHNKCSDAQVYLGISGTTGEAVYVGITSNLSRRSSAHGDRFSRLDPLTSLLPRASARAIEQGIIELHPEYQNKINSISPNNPSYQDSMAYWKDWARKNGYYGY